MDTEQAIIAALFTRLTTDPALGVALEGPVRVHLVLPDEEAPDLPYITHRLAYNTNDDRVVRSATYYLDIWDHFDVADRVHAARDRIITLLDTRRLVLPGGEADGLRFELEAHGFVPSDERNIWHYVMTFHTRYGRVLELAHILAEP